MRYSDRPDRSLSNEKRAGVLFTILFFNLILISSQIILKNRQSLLQSLMSSVVSLVQILFQKTTDYLSSQVNRYIFLKKNFSRYQKLQEKYIELKYQNYQLKRQLTDFHFFNQARARFKNFTMVKLISIDSGFPYNTIVIDLGSRAGVKENMTVLNTDGELVGRVTAPVNTFSATVRLITSPIGGCGGYIERNWIEGFLAGDNSPVCSFKYVVENKPTFFGDRVVTSGTDLIFPPYIPIGVVVKVEKEYLEQKIAVKPYFIEKPIKYLILMGNE